MDASSVLAGPRGGRRHVRRASGLVLAMVVVQLGLAALVGRPFLGAPAPTAALTLPWWALAAAFAVAGRVVFHVEVGRETKTVSVDELPLLLGLFFAAPVDLLIGSLVGYLANALWDRLPVAKQVWNCSLLSLQTALAVAVFHLVAGGQDPTAPSAWTGTYAAALVVNCLCSVAVQSVIALHTDGVDWRGTGREVATNLGFAAVLATTALVIATSLVASPTDGWLVLVAGVVVLFGYRAHARLRNRHADLERLYRFAQAASGWPVLDESLGDVLAEARALLYSQRAEVVLLRSGGREVARLRFGDGGPDRCADGPPDPATRWLLDRVALAGGPVLLARGTRDPDERRWLTGEAAREAIAVPLRAATGTLGLLVVTDRLGDVRSYQPGDVGLLETVADHAVAALRTAQVIDELRHDALHDALTGLPNRAQLQRRLATALDDVTGGRSAGVAVLLLDLDGFKQVNDTLGHEQGDRLLVQVAARLATAVGEAGLVARLGGDEFAVLLADVREESAVLRIGRRVLDALERPVVLDGTTATVGGSLGVALTTAHAPTHDPGTVDAGLLRRADLAMYAAKTAGGGMRLHTPDLGPARSTGAPVGADPVPAGRPPTRAT